MKTNNMNSSLRRVSIAATVLVVGLMINLNYVQGSQASKLDADPNNPRRNLNINSFPRGEILAGTEILAYSKPVGNSGQNQKYERFYNDGTAFFPVTGYDVTTTGSETGVELAYDSMLNGTNQGTTQNWFDSFTGKKPVGANVYTTIDPTAQKLAYKEIGITQRRAAAVVVDIKTGAIKVAASYPSFDPNSVAGTASGTQANAEFTTLQNQGLLAGDTNRAFNELFPPGSSFKTVVASAALENGFTTTSMVPAPFTAQIPQSTATVHNDAGGVCGSAASPLIETFAQSCNTTYALLGEQILGPQKVAAQATKYGFYKPIQYDPNLKTSASKYPTSPPASVFLGSFGQGDTQVTTLQMAQVASTVANNGTMMAPYLVQDVKNADGSDIYTANPQSLGNPIQSSTAQQIQEMMKAVVDHGTATVLKGRDIAGKTGTAETSGNLRTLWFVGFAPASNPKYAFAVMIEGNKGDFGASKAGPPAADIVAQVISDNK